jgi:hypothetical protein
MESMDSQGVVTFEVAAEEEGGYSAYARVGTWSMCTQGDDLDELHRMIQDLVEDYNTHESGGITAYALKFAASRLPVAA